MASTVSSQGNYRAQDGTDTRNYGGLDGLPEARALFGELLGLPAGEIMVGGNSSLTLMYQVVEFALSEGPAGALNRPGATTIPSNSFARYRATTAIFFRVRAPGYRDGHGAHARHRPDMDAVEALVKRDESIKGMWCVPRFSNPTGCVYSDDTVARIAALPGLAGANFLVMWDNAYAVYTLTTTHRRWPPSPTTVGPGAPWTRCSSSAPPRKLRLPARGGILASSPGNLAALSKHLSYQDHRPGQGKPAAPRALPAGYGQAVRTYGEARGP